MASPEMGVARTGSSTFAAFAGFAGFEGFEGIALGAGLAVFASGWVVMICISPRWEFKNTFCCAGLS
jgi:hypothetical protein